VSTLAFKILIVTYSTLPGQHAAISIALRGGFSRYIGPGPGGPRRDL